jgi:hypothetical protein
MLLPGTTAGKIDEFGTRFTIVNGAHFLIAGNGKEAWPISAAEAEEYKALHRRRMIIARWIRRVAILTPILMIIFGGAFLPKAQWVRETYGTVAAVLLVIGIPLSILQHTVTSDVTAFGIERRLKGRLTTGLREAITPQLTAAGWWGRRLIFAFVSLELGMMALHLILGRDALAQHMRIMYRMGDGNEDWLARLTGNLAWVLQFALILGIVLVMVDRRIRRTAGEQAKRTEAKESAREQLLRQLADEHRAATGQVAVSAPRTAVFGRNVRGSLPGGGDPAGR